MLAVEDGLFGQLGHCGLLLEDRLHALERNTVACDGLQEFQTVTRRHSSTGMIVVSCGPNTRHLPSRSGKHPTTVNHGSSHSQNSRTGVTPKFRLPYSTKVGRIILSEVCLNHNSEKLANSRHESGYQEI